MKDTRIFVNDPVHAEKRIKEFKDKGYNVSITGGYEVHCTNCSGHGGTWITATR